MVKLSIVESEIPRRKGTVGKSCSPHVSQEADREREAEGRVW